MPERDDVPVSGDRLIHMDGADGGIADRFQPSGDGYCAADVINVSAGAGDPGDDGVLQAVDRVRSQAQQAGAVGVDSGDSARLLKCFLGAVHPFADRMASPGMQQR